MTTQPDRKDILLRAAYDILKRRDDSTYVLEATATLAFYDGANCDGSCLMDDIRVELGLDERTRPIPLGPEEDESEDFIGEQ